MKVAINREYARNHLFVTVLMAGLGLWFAYDGLVRYPATDAAALYESIEGSAPGPGASEEGLERFKTQKIHTQYGFAALAFLASAVVGLRLLKSARLRVEWDDDGFSVGGKRFAFSDVKGVDERKWEKKGISRVDLGGGRRLVLDAWHHKGARELHDAIMAKLA